MSTSQDENAILVEHIRHLQSKIDKDEKELNQLKEKITTRENESIQLKEQVAELERVLLLENEAHEETKKENTELRKKLEAVEQDSVENQAQNQEKPSEDSSPKKEEQKEDKSHQIILNEILEMVKESEKRNAEARASDLLRLEEKINQLKTSSSQ